MHEMGPETSSASDLQLRWRQATRQGQTVPDLPLPQCARRSPANGSLRSSSSCNPSSIWFPPSLCGQTSSCRRRQNCHKDRAGTQRSGTDSTENNSMSFIHRVLPNSCANLECNRPCCVFRLAREHETSGGGAGAQEESDDAVAFPAHHATHRGRVDGRQRREASASRVAQKQKAYTSVVFFQAAGGGRE